MKWVYSHGKQGEWTTYTHGYPLQIAYNRVDRSGKGLHYRIMTRYSSEMFEHQFYGTLAEAKEASVSMLARHLFERYGERYENFMSGGGTLEYRKYSRKPGNQ